MQERVAKGPGQFALGSKIHEPINMWHMYEAQILLCVYHLAAI